MATYNGHKNRNFWNVSLWINNDEGLYNIARMCVRQAANRADAARAMFEIIAVDARTETPQTPDGIPYSVSAIRAAMVGL